MSDDIDDAVDSVTDSLESEAERVGIGPVELAERVLTETKARNE